MRLPKHGLTALACALLWIPAAPRVAAAQQDSTQQVARIPDAQLDSLVAPIALYPDPLLAQVLAASTYPLELVEMQQWIGQHKDLKDQALVDAVSKQTWDASVQGLAALPEVVKKMTEDIKWTTELGNAFLAQESDVMDAVQRMRGKASGAGKLKSNDKMKVETQTVENKSVIVIEQSNPQVVYVPEYNPTVVYGAPVAAYPYPSVGYPLAGAAISFGVGMAMGAAFSGGWGYNCGWHGGGGNNNININNNNNFVKNSGGNRAGGGNQWQHNPQHRGGTPYGNRDTANKFGGTTRGEGGARAQGGGNRGQGGQIGGGDRGGADRGGGNRGGGQVGGGDRGGANRGGGDRGGGQAGGGNRGGGGGGDRVGNRSVQSGNRGGGGGSAFGGGGGGGSGQAARSSSSRGGRSAGGGGGGRGGGGRGGGGRR